MGRTFFSLAALCLLVTSQAFAAQEWITLQPRAKEGVSMQVLRDSGDEIILEYRLGGLQTQDVAIDGQTYTQVTVPGATELARAGWPAVAKLGRDLLIEDTGSYTFEIIEKKSRELDLGILAPSKGDLERNLSPEQVPYQFSDFYESGASYPERVFSLGDPFVLRSVRGINAQFHPVIFHADTQKTEVIEKLRVRIRRVSGLVGKNELRTRRANHAEFRDVYRNHFANPQHLDSAKALPEPDTVGRVLIISHPSFVNAVKPLADWKIQKGFPTRIVTTEETGNDPQNIKAFIQRQYDSEGVAQIILVGDADFVPYFQGTAGNVRRNEADPMYGLLAGNDSYPDAVVSRLSARVPDEVTVQVNKSIRYEKDPAPGNWTTHHLGIASSEGTPKDFERMRTLQDVLRTWTFDRFSEAFEPSARIPDIANPVNAGVGFINYIGHGAKTYWLTTGFSNTEIDQLRNNVWPVIVSVACVVGDFGAGGDSFTERWQKAGTPDAPRGSLVHFGSSTNQSWVPPTVGQRRIVDLMKAEKLTNVGELLFSGSIAVLEDNSSTAVQTFQSWHIFGDGSVQLRSRPPVRLAPEFVESISSADEVFSVRRLPAHSLVSLTHEGEIIASAYANASGEVRLPLAKIGGHDEVTLTITAYNAIPLITRIPVE